MSSERKEVEDRLLDRQARMAALEEEQDAAKAILGDPKASEVAHLSAANALQRIRTSIEKLKPQIAELRLAKKRLDDVATDRAAERTAIDREKAAAVEAALVSAREEDRGFWFRRFHTSLALAHGAAFAAIASKLFDATVDSSTAAGAWYPMSAFAFGMLLAGLIPVALYRESLSTAWRLAIVSAALFVLGLAAALVSVWIKAGLVWPWQLY